VTHIYPVFRGLKHDWQAGGLPVIALALTVAVCAVTSVGVFNDRVWRAMQGRAAETLRERERLCPDVAILADVHVKHATPLGSESIEDAARETLGRGLADAVILTGAATGCAPDPEAVARVRRGIGDGRILVGAGLTAEDVGLLRHADGAIVGTWLKHEGRIERAVDPARVRRLRTAMDEYVARGRDGTPGLPDPRGSR